MRPPPAVTVRCAGGWPWRALQVGLPALAVLVLGAWALRWLEASTPTAFIASGLCAAFGVVAFCRARPRAAHDLRWDGRQWSVDDQPGPVQLMMDFGAFVILRQRRGSARSQWLAVTADEAGVHWHALRSALYARGAGEADAPSRQPVRS